MYEILEKNNNRLEHSLYGKIQPLFFEIYDAIYSDSIVKDISKDNISDEIIMLFMTSTWNNTLDTGITNIDNQHKEIFSCIGKLLNSTEQNKEKDEIVKILTHLEECVIRHCNEEEAIQEQYKYPKCKLQCEQHKKFISELNELISILDESSVSVLFIINMQQKMFKWYRKHILNLDKDFGEFLLKQVKNKQI